MKKKFSILDKVSFAAMGLIFGIVLAGNVVAGYNGEMITTYFYGSGVNFENNKKFTEAVSQSKELNQKIAEEGRALFSFRTNTIPDRKSVV